MNTDTMSTNTVPNAYYLTEAPAYIAPVRNTEGDTVNYGDVALWSGEAPPPRVGTRVLATMNRLGPGTVRGYFTESGWLGVHIELEKPPAWWVKQNADRSGRRRWACLFGVEIAPTTE